jgi:hypothetical protein
MPASFLTFSRRPAKETSHEQRARFLKKEKKEKQAKAETPVPLAASSLTPLTPANT